MSKVNVAAQAGWYAVGGGQERYWDGVGWTDEVRPVPRYVGVGRPGERFLTAV